MPALSYTEIGNEKVLPTIKTTDTEGNSAKYVSNQVGGKKSRKNKTNKKIKKIKRNKSSKTNKRNKKMKGGSINYALFSQDPMLGNSTDAVSSGGNTSGAIQAANIFNQGGASNYASSSANMKASILV